MHYYLGLILLLVAAAYLANLIWLQIRHNQSAVQNQALHRQLLEKQVDEIISNTSAKKAAPDLLSWSGWRKFKVVDVVHENDEIKSFYLSPHDGKQLPDFLPGQHLTFRLKVPGHSKPVVRCYSLSGRAVVPDEKPFYRVTIKLQKSAADHPDGVASSYFHAEVVAGDILDVKAPSGKFYLDTTEKTPVVLVAGGVGLTPSLSILNTLSSLGSEREIWLFNATPSPQAAFMTEELGKLKQSLPRLRVFSFYSQADSTSLFSNERAGRLSCGAMQQLGAPYHADYYVCGPAGMMKSIVGGLRELGVDEQRLHFESFGPASLTQSSSKLVSVSPENDQNIAVTFKASNKSLDWSSSSGTLLEAAESAGIEIESGCRSGNCGTCLTAMLSGDVSYIEAPGDEVEKGSCLPCIAIPCQDLVLDA